MDFCAKRYETVSIWMINPCAVQKHQTKQREMIRNGIGLTDCYLCNPKKML